MVVLILTMEQHEIKIISCPGVLLEFPQLTWTRQGHNTILPVFNSWTARMRKSEL